MKPIRQGIDKLADLIDEAYEFHHLVIYSRPDEIMMQLIQDDEIVFTGTTLVKRRIARLVCAERLTSGLGEFYFGDKQLSNEGVRSLCASLEKYLHEREKDSLIRADVRDASAALGRIMRGSRVFTEQAQAYQRLERTIAIPKVTDLPRFVGTELKKIQEQIDDYGSCLERGDLICILNIDALHPLHLIESEVISHIVDPQIRVYRTGMNGSYDFRQSLRSVAKLE